MSEDDQTSILKVLVQLRDEVTDPLKQVNDRFSEMAENFASIGMAAGEVFAGYEALNQVIEPAAAMQDQMVGLKEATLANADALEKYKQQADEIGSSMPLTGGAEEALQAMTELYKTFRDDKSLKEQTELAVQLATVMGDTAPMAAKVLSSAVMNLGDTSRPATEQMKEFGDEIAVLQTRFPMGSGGLMRMAMALRMLGSAAKVNNINQKEMFAMMAEGNRISLGGPRGSGPILAEIVNSLLKMKDGRYELEKYGHFVQKTADGHVDLIKTLENLSKMNDKQRRTLEGSMGSQGANVSLLISHLDDLKEAYNEINNANGQMSKDAQERAETFNSQIKELKNSWQEFKESIGKHILPDLTGDLKQLKGFVDEMNKFSENHPAISKGVSKEVELGGGVLTLLGIGKLTSKLWSALKLPALFGGSAAAAGAGGEVTAASGGTAVGTAATGGGFSLMGLIGPAIAGVGAGIAIDAIAKDLRGVWFNHQAEKITGPDLSKWQMTPNVTIQAAAPQITIQTVMDDAKGIERAVTGSLSKWDESIVASVENMFHDNARRSFGGAH